MGQTTWTHSRPKTKLFISGAESGGDSVPETRELIGSNAQYKIGSHISVEVVFDEKMAALLILQESGPVI